MRNFWVLMVGLTLLGCKESEPALSDFTGNEVVYSLHAGSVYPIYGTATFKEKKDGSAEITIQLKGTEGNLQHPVHLHMGDISDADADISALLNPVLGSSSKSTTHLIRLANEETISYAELIKLDACIKIHLAEFGPDRDVILAGGNIGKGITSTNGRISVGVCKSE